MKSYKIIDDITGEYMFLSEGRGFTIIEYDEDHISYGPKKFISIEIGYLFNQIWTFQPVQKFIKNTYHNTSSFVYKLKEYTNNLFRRYRKN